MARFINADAYAATGIGLLGNNMYIYCNNNPISYIDSTGKTLRKAVTAICMVSEGSHRIPDVGNGNYSNFEEEYMEIAVPTINSVITRSQANQYYDTIKAGDYSQMINPLDCFDLFSYFDEMKGADYVEIWFNFLSNRPQSNNQNVYDPNGRLLYLEEGYTVITIHRVFIGVAIPLQKRNILFLTKEWNCSLMT